jgi:hypothetical protein
MEIVLGEAVGIRSHIHVGAEGGRRAPSELQNGLHTCSSQESWRVKEVSGRSTARVEDGV